MKVKVASGLIRWYMNQMGYYGWTSFWDTIYIRYEYDLANKRLLRHEMKHLEQIRRDGYVIFSIKYLYYSWKYGYLKNPYEIEARRAENG